MIVRFVDEFSLTIVLHLWQSAAKQQRRRRKVERSVGKIRHYPRIPLELILGDFWCRSLLGGGQGRLSTLAISHRLSIVVLMKLGMKAIGFEMTTSLRRYVGEKLVRPMEKLLGRNPAWQATSLDLELICGTHHHKKGRIWEASANLALPGARLWKRVTAEEIHIAIDGLEQIFKRELTRYKERSRSRLLRGARRAKREIRFDRSARISQKGRVRDEGM